MSGSATGYTSPRRPKSFATVSPAHNHSARQAARITGLPAPGVRHGRLQRGVNRRLRQAPLMLAGGKDRVVVSEIGIRAFEMPQG